MDCVDWKPRLTPNSPPGPRRRPIRERRTRRPPPRRQPLVHVTHGHRHPQTPTRNRPRGAEEEVGRARRRQQVVEQQLRAESGAEYQEEAAERFRAIQGYAVEEAGMLKRILLGGVDFEDDILLHEPSIMRLSS